MDKRWTTDLIPAFLSLPRGGRSLSEIYGPTRENRAARGVIIKKCPDDAIRATLQYNCATSPWFKGKNIFYFENGRWGLRDEFWPTPDAPDNGAKILVETPEPGYWRNAQGVIVQLASPEILADRAVLAALAAESSAHDPRVELFVGLRLRCAHAA